MTLDLNKKEEIFLQVLDAHKGIIYKIAKSYCKQALDREDLIQEIIIQLWTSLDKYDDQYKQSTWIYRIALNTAISFYRKSNSRKGEISGITSIIDFPDETDANDNLDLALLNQSIQELRELDKALILLHLEGLSYKEIAEAMNLSPTNVTTKISRIKNGIKKKFETRK